MIFEALSDLQDIVRLSHASRYLRSMSAKRIQKGLLSTFGPWAGDRVICAGDYLDLGDYPPESVTEEQMASLAVKNEQNPDPLTQAFFNEDIERKKRVVSEDFEKLSKVFHPILWGQTSDTKLAKPQ